MYVLVFILNLFKNIIKDNEYIHSNVYIQSLVIHLHQFSIKLGKTNLK